MTYEEKLKDPRWQSKRREILERDNHKCQKCGNKTLLEVHHLLYHRNTDPWDYDNIYLVTLCEYCHEGETNKWEDAKKLFTTVISERKFFASDIDRISYTIHSMGKEEFLKLLSNR